MINDDSAPVKVVLKHREIMAVKPNGFGFLFEAFCPKVGEYSGFSLHRYIYPYTYICIFSILYVYYIV